MLNYKSKLLPFWTNVNEYFVDKSFAFSCKALFQESILGISCKQIFFLSLSNLFCVVVVFFFVLNCLLSLCSVVICIVDSLKCLPVTSM